jgi:hypothetical protein
VPMRGMPTSAPAMLRSFVLTLVIALLANLGVWLVMVLIWGNRDFAGLITGLGSIAAVLGLCHGCVEHWRRQREILGPQLGHAKALVKRASAAGWVVGLGSLALLVFVRPDGWTAWTYGLVWGVGGGAAFAVTFRRIANVLAEVSSLTPQRDM